MHVLYMYMKTRSAKKWNKVEKKNVSLRFLHLQ
jgi:hypothetical protein